MTMNDTAMREAILSRKVPDGHRLRIDLGDGRRPLHATWGGCLLRLGDFVADIASWRDSPTESLRERIERSIAEGYLMYGGNDPRVVAAHAEEEAARILRAWGAHREFLLGLGLSSSPYYPTPQDAARGILPAYQPRC